MGNRISELILARGNAKAQGQAASGQIWGQTIGQLGQIAGNAVAQIPELRAQHAAQREEEALRQMFRGESLPTPDAIISVVGPERGMKIAQGLAALRPDPQKDFQNTQTILRDVLLGINELSEPLRAEVYPQVRQNLLTRGVIKQEDAPEQYSTAFWTTATQYGQQPAKAEGGFTLPEGSTRFDATGAPIASVPKPAPIKERAFEPVTIRGPRGDPSAALFVKSEGKYYKPDGKTEIPGDQVVPYERSTQGAQPSYQWAKGPDGTVRLMTTGEIRRLGAGQPDTADMRNKVAGKKVAAMAVQAVRELGSKVLTKVGPAQRMEAVKRGAEAVFGNDPEFRTYQDSRMALAGTLAVEQQGARVSDADVRALWLPMVPDAYRDTKESNELKWKLIDVMRGVEGSREQKPVAMRAPDGRALQVPAEKVDEMKRLGATVVP